MLTSDRNQPGAGANTHSTAKNVSAVPVDDVTSCVLNVSSSPPRRVILLMSRLTVIHKSQQLVTHASDVRRHRLSY